ncbi:2Fe-2S iron-sulfur cluster binding domain-containing protein [Bradyrhizobium sp. Arg68]|uniref:adenylate/guanylate cyclase domain-containing protein n=1 Tax=Bradyrhizobium ivorense TaxID=2511166 RepID=UPI0027E39A97|nr:adenylate/guanylate cyclase domain-containing protein [Bradyrhizobium ivorense]MCC8935669.1 2Fe-2S iron-sulfur cluster binding domain-containing protein [Bradyrhizobium ivorense]
MHRITYSHEVTIAASDGQTLLDASIENRIPHHHQCGGQARCTTCRVQILDGLSQVSPRTPLEEQVAAERSWDDFTRLACQTRIHGDVTIRRLLHSPQDVVVLDLDELGTGSGTEERELDVAVLFCDIRNFTSQTEHSLPYDVVYFLNGHFSAAAEVVLNNNGLVDKYIGDGLLAIFGIRGEPPDVACRNAVRAAIAMQDAAQRLSPIFERDLGISLCIGIGVHFGPVILGRIGHPGKRQLTVIGNTVNAASRIERMTKQLDAPILLSESVVAHLPGALRLGAREERHLKGMSDTSVLSRCDGFTDPDPVLLVQSSFHRIAPRLIGFGTRFYAILFESHPELRPLFKNDMLVQTRMLVSMLSSLVKGLNRATEIKGGVRALGGRHCRYGAAPADYQKVADALLQTLAEFLEDDFTAEVRGAWVSVFGTISGLMLGGADAPEAEPIQAVCS